jgi:hypothetical protein
MAIVSGKQREWARLGAQARLVELQQEAGLILRTFPELKSNRTAGIGLRAKRRISAAARRAMSEGMRRYWARRRAGAKEKAATK